MTRDRQKDHMDEAADDAPAWEGYVASSPLFSITWVSGSDHPWRVRIRLPGYEDKG